MQCYICVFGCFYFERQDTLIHSAHMSFYTHSAQTMLFFKMHTTTFTGYHMEHHKFQGEDIIDVDIPTSLEGWFFHSTPRKVLWCFLQPLFYSLRPLFVNPKPPTRWEYINIAAILLFDSAIVYIWGIGGLLYLVVGTLLGMGLHPVAGHFIAEHYVMNLGQETYSYYGPLNWLTFNVGKKCIVVCVCFFALLLNAVYSHYFFFFYFLLQT